jgi:hypothetical protein
MHTEAFTLKGAGPAPAIAETVQDNSYALFLQSGDLVEDVHNTPVIRWIRNIETYKV